MGRDIESLDLCGGRDARRQSGLWKSQRCDGIMPMAWDVRFVGRGASEGGSDVVVGSS